MKLFSSCFVACSSRDKFQDLMVIVDRIWRIIKEVSWHPVRTFNDPIMLGAAIDENYAVEFHFMCQKIRTSAGYIYHSDIL